MIFCFDITPAKGVKFCPNKLMAYLNQMTLLAFFSCVIVVMGSSHSISSWIMLLQNSYLGTTVQHGLSNSMAKFNVFDC